VTNLDPEIFVTPEDEAELNEVLHSTQLPQSGFIVFNPFNRRHSKTWPVERYVELGLSLHRDTGIPIAVSGSPLETSFNHTLKPLLDAGAAVSLVGKLTLGQAFALFRRARLMISGDSGPAHAAAALGTPVVALFGPTFPERTRPWGEAHTVIQKLRPPTHYTYQTDSERIHMKAIDVESVYEAAMAKIPAVSTR
jgi:ADP-heptose:LPS heptosyltransferase